MQRKLPVITVKQMKKTGMFYWLLNGLFHVVHIAIILFVMIGWIFPSLLVAHLVVTLLTLGSWFVLGYWLGTGYCPISDWHWKIKARFGEGRPDGTYIHLLLQRMTGKEWDSDAVDKAVLIVTMVIMGISLVSNLIA